LKARMAWGASVPTEITYAGSKKPEKATLVAPESVGSKPFAASWAAEHDGKLVRVQVMS